MMPRFYRIAWESRLTGRTGCGDWLDMPKEQLEMLAEALDKQYPGIVHAVESASADDFDEDEPSIDEDELDRWVSCCEDPD